MVDRALQEKTERRRQRGDNIVKGQKLTVSESYLDRTNYEYRWINDNGGRIDQMTKDDDWDLVPDPSKAGKPDSDDVGSMISKVVGRSDIGIPMRAYLARKPKGFYEEDQRDKRESIDKTMAAIKSGTPQTEAQPLGQHGYVPNGPGAIQIKSVRQ